MLKQSVLELVTAGEITVEGSSGRLEELLAMLDNFSLGFPIVEPRPAKG